MRVAQGVKAGALRKFQVAEQEGDGGGNRVRLQRGAVRIAKDVIALVAFAVGGPLMEPRRSFWWSKGVPLQSSFWGG